MLNFEKKGKDYPCIAFDHKLPKSIKNVQFIRPLNFMFSFYHQAPSTSAH